MSDRRLIEDSLPLKRLSELSAKDKASKKAHVRNLLLYWSCKPLPVSRVIAYASAIPSPKSNDDLKKEILFVEQLAAYGVEHNDDRVLKRARKRLQEQFPSGLTMHDPFSGSGAHSLEAQRLGLKAIASDLNPVAALLSDAVIRLIPSASIYESKTEIGQHRLDSEVRVSAANIRQRITERLKQSYKGFPRIETMPFAYIWFRIVKCSSPKCRKDVPLTSTWTLSKASGNHWSLKPKFKNNGLETEIIQGIYTGPTTVSRSKVVCPWCNSVSSNGYLRSEAMEGRVGHRLMAVAWQADGSSKRYRLPTEEEINAAEVRVDNIDIDFPAFPQDDTRKFTPALFGVQKWSDLHTPRQLYSLSEFAKAIKDELSNVSDRCSDLNSEEKNVFVQSVGFILTASLCRMADLLTSLCGWEPNAQAVRHLYTGKAVPMMWNYGEANPLAQASGSWGLCVKRTLKSLEKAPREYSGSYAQMSAAQDMVANFVDIIVTDPPYYDAIAYAHLSDFFVPWIREAMGDFLPDWFSVTSTPKRREIIQRPKGFKTKTQFESDMFDALSQMSNNLKDGGILTLVYAHKSTSAWETLFEALLRSNFVVVATWPIETEMSARKDARGNSSLTSTVYFICRKRVVREDGFLDDVESELQARLHERLDYFWSQGIRGADFFMSAIGPAVEVFGKYKKVLKLSGEEVSIGELLDKVRTIVADYALQRIVHGESAGDVDEASRFYVIWRWAFGTAEVESGEAIHMAQSMGCEFNELVTDKGILKKKGDKVGLKGPIDRKKVKGLGEITSAGFPSPLIDVLHRSANLWSAGRRQDLADFLNEALLPGGLEKMHRLAQSIVDVLAPGDKERALYENFLVGARSLPAPTEKNDEPDKQMKLF